MSSFWFLAGLFLLTLRGFAEEKLKVAMFFSGRVLTYEESPWLLELRDRYSMDLFCSINSELDPYHQLFLEQFGIKKSHFEVFQPPDSFIRMFQAGHSDNPPSHVASMFYHRKKCMELILDYQKEQNILYDIIICMRADILAVPPCRLKIIKDSYLHIPIGNDHGGINDRTAYGSLETMKSYCHLFDHIEEYFDAGCRFHPETLLKFHINRQKLDVIRFDFPSYLNPRRYLPRVPVPDQTSCLPR